MFEKILIANRGEIALRILRACRDAGLQSVAVYADADADAPYLRLADHAFALPGTTPAETYLNIPALLDIARDQGGLSEDGARQWLDDLAAQGRYARDVY